MGNREVNNDKRIVATKTDTDVSEQRAELRSDIMGARYHLAEAMGKI